MKKKLPIRLGEDETHVTSIPISGDKRELKYFLKKLPKKDLDKDPKFTQDFLEVSFTEKLLALMDKKKMTIEMLAEKIGKTKAYTKRAVYHPFHVNIFVLFAITDALGMKLNIVFTDVKHKSKRVGTLADKANELLLKHLHTPHHENTTYFSKH